MNVGDSREALPFLLWWGQRPTATALCAAVIRLNHIPYPTNVAKRYISFQ